jgi:hypothetical protein
MLLTSGWADSLFNEHLNTLMRVHPLQVLLKIIKPRPLLLALWATISETLVLLALAMLWLYLMNTLLMSLEVVDSCEALRSLTTRFPTYMLFFVSGCMFSKANINIVHYQEAEGRRT